MTQTYTLSPEECTKFSLIAKYMSPYMAFKSPKVAFRLLMDVTNVCDYKCPICYKQNGDSRMSLVNFKAIIDSTIGSSPRFLKLVCITGGEPAALYTHYNTSDLRDMIQYCFDKNAWVILKTNAGWTMGDMSDKIWRDMEGLENGQNCLIFNLSVDKYHKNVLQTTNRFLKHVCMSERLKNKTALELIAVGNDGGHIDNIISADNLGTLGLTLSEIKLKNFSYRGPEVKYWEGRINETPVMLCYEGKIIKVGRAKENNIGDDPVKTNLRVVSPNHTICLWYDPTGMVHIGNKHIPYFSTPYLIPGGGINPLAVIEDQLGEQLFKECKKEALENIAEPETAKLLNMISRAEADLAAHFYKLPGR